MLESTGSQFVACRTSTNLSASDGGASHRTSIFCGPPTEHELAVYATMAAQANNSKLYKHLGDESGIMMVMLMARELNIPPMMALNNGIRPIQGNLEISARLLTALIRRAGHVINVVQSTDELCVVEGIRKNNRERLTTSYSIEDAKRASLIRPGGGWVKNPRDMCFARAVSRLGRQLFSDVIGIGYVEGEVSERYETTPSADVYCTVPSKEEETTVEEFLNQFEVEERPSWLAYLQAVSSTFGWTKKDTIGKFSQNLNETRAKFDKWKNKASL